MSVTVTNNATTGSITLTGATIGGANAGDFAVTGGSCGRTLAASSSCTYAVTFTPSTENAESGTLSIAVAEDPNGGPPAVGLSGTGATPLKVAPAAISFGTVTENTTSKPKTVTVTNLGGAAVSLSESVGGTNRGDFAVTGGTCGADAGGRRRILHLHADVHAEHGDSGERDAWGQRVRRCGQPAQREPHRRGHGRTRR